MVDWNSPETLRFSLLLFRQTAVFILGGYVWYIILTFKDVELRLVLRHMAFRVAHIPYLLARYMNVCELLTIVLSSYVPRTVHSCGPIAWPIILTAVSGNVALAAASTNIAFRVIMIWKEQQWVSRLLTAACVIDICLAVLLGAFSIDSMWDEEHQICLISAGKTQRGLLSLYCFTVVWHIVILVLTVIGIRRKDVIARSSPLISMLYHQSFGYAVLMCVTCIPMAIIVYLNLNSIINVIPALIGTTVAVMTSSSSVTSLFRLTNPSPTSSTSSAPHPPRVPRRQHRRRRPPVSSHRPTITTTTTNSNGPVSRAQGNAEKPESISNTDARPRGLGLSDFLSDSDSDSDIEYEDGYDEDDTEDGMDVGALTTHINIGSTSDFRLSDDIAALESQDHIGYVQRPPSAHFESSSVAGWTESGRVHALA